MSASSVESLAVVATVEPSPKALLAESRRLIDKKKLLAMQCVKRSHVDGL